MFPGAKPATCAHRFPIRRTPRMRALLDVILIALQIYIWLVIAAAILSWLVAFNVVNTRNPFVAAVGEFLGRMAAAVHGARHSHDGA